jgi:hypothetical protein
MLDTVAVLPLGFVVMVACLYLLDTKHCLVVHTVAFLPLGFVEVNTRIDVVDLQVVVNEWLCLVLSFLPFEHLRTVVALVELLASS